MRYHEQKLEDRFWGEVLINEVAPCHETESNVRTLVFTFTSREHDQSSVICITNYVKTGKPILVLCGNKLKISLY